MDQYEQSTVNGFDAYSQQAGVFAQRLCPGEQLMVVVGMKPV